MRLVVVALVATALGLPGAASGGGWWSFVHVDPSVTTAGQRVEVRAEFLFRSAAEAADAETRADYSVYLLRGFDYAIVDRAMREQRPGNWWSLGDAEGIRLAPVALTTSGNLGRARALVTVPDVGPGTYAVMLCDAGCARPLGDVVPTPGFTVVADRATARLVAQVDRLRLRTALQAARLEALRRAAARTRTALAGAESTVEQLEARVDAVERRPARVVSSGSSAWASAGWLVAGALVAAAAALALGRRRIVVVPQAQNGARRATRPARFGPARLQRPTRRGRSQSSVK